MHLLVHFHNMIIRLAHLFIVCRHRQFFDAFAAARNLWFQNEITCVELFDQLTELIIRHLDTGEPLPANELRKIRVKSDLVIEDVLIGIHRLEFPAHFSGLRPQEHLVFFFIRKKIPFVLFEETNSQLSCEFRLNDLSFYVNRITAVFLSNAFGDTLSALALSMEFPEFLLRNIPISQRDVCLHIDSILARLC